MFFFFFNLFGAQIKPFMSYHTTRLKKKKKKKLLSSSSFKKEVEKLERFIFTHTLFSLTAKREPEIGASLRRVAEKSRLNVFNFEKRLNVSFFR